MKTQIEQNNPKAKFNYLVILKLLFDDWNLFIGYSRQLAKYCLMIGICLLVIKPPTIHAQQVSLAISPPVVEILLQPNKKVTQTFNLKASGDNLTATPEIHLVSPADSTGHVTIDPNPITPSALPLTITSNPPLGSVLPVVDSELSFTLTLEAASSDISQDVYLALVFKINSADDPLSSQSAATPGISALILTTITPTGVLPISLEVKNFTLPYFHDSWLSITPSPVLVNNSPIMIRTVGKYEIISPTGKTVFSLPLYPSLILGNSKRDIQGADKEFDSDKAESDTKPLPLTWSPKNSNIGPYRIRLTTTTLGGTKISELEKVVWILPIRLIIITILLIIIVIMFYRDKNKNTAR